MKNLPFFIENGLRKAISRIYENKHGTGWWDIVIEPKVGNGIKNTYQNQFAAFISDGDIFINYTHTFDLKKIISANWGAFRHLFENKTVFEALVVELNVIRKRRGTQPGYIRSSFSWPRTNLRRGFS